MKRFILKYLCIVLVLFLVAACSPSTPNPNSFIAVACGRHHTLALKNDGTLWATGCNEFGQLGTRDNTHKNTFTQVLTNVKAMAGSNSHSIVLKADGTLWATGCNEFGQLGTGDNNYTNFWMKVLP